jgi:hypothetical protein
MAILGSTSGTILEPFFRLTIAPHCLKIICRQDYATLGQSSRFHLGAMSEFLIMRYAGKIMIGAGLVMLSFSPAMARISTFGATPIMSPTNYPGAPRPVYDDVKTPYAMNYADEAAQTLGIKDRQLDLFSAKPAENASYLPSISGGVGGDGAMFKLQWHPGE